MLKIKLIKHQVISGNSKKRNKNIAIIAHVDHGKTTLWDAMLKQTELSGK